MKTRTFAAILAALALSAPAAGLAQTPPPAAPAPASAADRKAELADQFLAAVASAMHEDLEAEVTKGALGGLEKDAEAFNARPEWPDLLRKAMAVEVHANWPRFRKMMANVLLADFTTEELQAGLVFFQSPGGQQLMAHPKGPMSPAMRTALMALQRTPAGRSLNRKFGAFDPSPDALKAMAKPMVGDLVPRIYLRFVQEARAIEKPAPALTADEERAVKLAHIAIGAADFKSYISNEVPKMAAGMDDPVYPAGWRDLMTQAAQEEFGQGLSLMELAFGRAMARYFTPEELAAGVQFLDSPAGADFLAYAQAKDTGEASAKMDKATEKALRKLMSSPAGKGFMEKLSHIGKIEDGPEMNDFAAAFTLDILERFSRKALAAQPAS